VTATGAYLPADNFGCAAAARDQADRDVFSKFEGGEQIPDDRRLPSALQVLTGQARQPA
jgi:hypothetical protein